MHRIPFGASTTDARDLDYLEKHSLPIPTTSGNKKVRQPRQYHSQLSGDGIFGISAYGLTLLCFLVLVSFFTYALSHGLWHLCLHLKNRAS